MGRLGEYVEPLKKSLEKVETNVNLLEQQRQRAYGEIHKELEIVRSTHEGLRLQTGNLVSALRGDSQVRGQWGEIQLKRVIEMAGMLSVLRLRRAAHVAGDDGTLLRPDVIVKLPGGKSIVIDSKVSLAGYLRAHQEGADDEARRAGMADHARQVRTHIQSARPEGVLAAAAGNARVRRHVPPRRVLLARGARRRSVPARARAVEQRDPGHAHEPDRAPSRRPLRLAAGDDRRGRPADQRPRTRAVQAALDDGGAHVSKLGRSLDGAVKSYNETVGSLERQVLPQARRFEQHGITGIEPPELTPVDRQTRTLSAPELVGSPDDRLKPVADVSAA